MKEIILSNCERNFILKAAHEFKRLDGRKLEGFRDLKVYFGQEWGLCYTALGETKVLTQVTCEIQQPKTTRPNEGLLFINVELSSMAAPNFESNRTSDLSVHINRLLEKCIKDSGAVDLESLCIVAEEKVWVLRVDVNILNHDGSLVDCASISALAALAHFKRPDVTMDGQEIIVHSLFEKDPIPTTLHHFPVCISFALLNNSENIFADPTFIEERVSDASLTFGLNAYREICCLHLGGIALTEPKLILTCSVKAANRAKVVVEMIQEALRNDLAKRELKTPVGFTESFEWDKVTSMSEGRLKIQLSKFVLQNQNFNKDNSLEESVTTNGENYEITNLGDNCAELKAMKKSIDENNSEFSPAPKFLKTENVKNVLQKRVEVFGEGGSSKWKVESANPVVVIDSDSSSSDEKDDISELPVSKKEIDSIDINDDSEEEEVVILNSSDVNNSQTFSQKRHSKSLLSQGQHNSQKTGFSSDCNKSKRNRKKKGKKNFV